MDRLVLDVLQLLSLVLRQRFAQIALTGEPLTDIRVLCFLFGKGEMSRSVEEILANLEFLDHISFLS